MTRFLLILLLMIPLIPARTLAEPAATAAEEEAWAAGRPRLLSTPAPTSALATLTGATVDPSAFPRRSVLLVFSDRKAKDQGVEWFKEYARDFLPFKDLVIINLVYPGSGSGLASRQGIKRKIEKEVNEVNAEVRASLPEGLKPSFDAMAAHWHIDWSRQYTQDLLAPRHRIALVLVNNGRIVDYEDEVSSRGMNRILSMLRSGPLATAPVKPAGSRPGSPLLEKIRQKQAR